MLAATRTYDDAGRTTGITVKEGASNRAVIAYTHDRAGMARTHAQTITGATSGNGTASLAYDHLGRITGYDSPLGSTSDRDYAWARVVNRTGVTSDPSGTPSTATLAFDDADRITTSGHATDAQGRVLTRPSRQLVWDSLGRLTTVKDGPGTTTLASYTYDALDRVRTRTASGVTMLNRYVGTSSSLAVLYDMGAGAIDRRFTNDLAERPTGYISSSSTNPATWIVDAHHDVVATIGSDGDIDRWYRYDPWGTQVATGGTGINSHQRFQSSYTDGVTGMVWMVSRWYDPSLGRFLSEDSLLGEPVNPDSRHRYAYGEGDPVNTWDPDGRKLKIIGDFTVEDALGCWNASRRTLAVETCAIAYEVMKHATRYAKDRFYSLTARSDDRERDACRHCLNAGWLTVFLKKDVHESQRLAWLFLDAHEANEPKGTPRLALRQRMDQLNNGIGVRIGARAKRSGTGDPGGYVMKHCIAETTRGRLWVIGSSRGRLRLEHGTMRY